MPSVASMETSARAAKISEPSIMPNDVATVNLVDEDRAAVVARAARRSKGERCRQDSGDVFTLQEASGQPEDVVTYDAIIAVPAHATPNTQEPFPHLAA